MRDRDNKYEINITVSDVRMDGTLENRKHATCNMRDEINVSNDI